MQPVSLIHPIYLDVPMMVSFAAAIEGGIAFDSEVTETEADQKGKKSSIKGRFGLSALFESLFDAGLEAEGQTTNEISKNQIKKEQRAHTESSIAILLYDSLSNKQGYLVQPTSIKELETLKQGTLIELAGKVEKNAVDSIIDYIDVLSILSSLNTSGTKRDTNESRKTLQNIRNSLDQDRQRTPLSNIILRCDTPSNLSAVVTLRTENLRDLTLSELDQNNVRIVGKVTRSIGEGEKMSTFENYGLSLVLPDTLNQAFSSMANSEGLKVKFSDVEVEGPAIQVLPLMIFV